MLFRSPLEWKPKGSFTPAPPRDRESTCVKSFKPKSFRPAESHRLEWKPRPKDGDRPRMGDRPRSSERARSTERTKLGWKPKAPGGPPRQDQAARPARRDKNWRPGGEHKDPRQKYKDAKKAVTQTAAREIQKLKVLRSLRPMDLASVRRDTVRGQYGPGVSDGVSVRGYLQEDQVPSDSMTETFVALRMHIDNARWAHVPFFLRTGKRMQNRRSEIIIQFAEQPFSVFGRQPNHQPNRLIISLQPEESIHLGMMVKEPGSGMRRRPVTLDLDLHEAFNARRAEAYERLLVDVTRARLTHFMRRDELEAAWRWIEPILEGWQSLDDKPRSYPAGSWGPAASSALMARDNLSWFEEA